MDFKRSFVFTKCFCCHKNYNKADLAEINNSCITIGEEDVLLSDLVLDCCFFRVSLRIFCEFELRKS